MGVRYDVVCTIGTYQAGQETKYVNRKVGAIIDTQKGVALKLDASFNPAGCIKNDDGSVWLQLYTPKPKEGAQQQQQPQQQGYPAAAPQPHSQPAPPPMGEFSDDIPF